MANWFLRKMQRQKVSFLSGAGKIGHWVGNNDPGDVIHILYKKFTQISNRLKYKM